MKKEIINAYQFNPFFSYKMVLDKITNPINKELCATPLTFEDSLPEEILGVYYRNGPNQKNTPFSYHHLVDGHGMVHQFKFESGKIFYSNRWVRTKIFSLENKLNRCLIGSFLRPFQSDAKVKRLSSRERTKANTHVIRLKNKVFAFEEGGVPYLLSPNDLSTIGVLEETLNYRTTVTGHPKYDFYEKKLYCLNWNGEENYAPCTVFVFDDEGNVENYDTIDLPYRSFIHDFAITKNYILLPIFPCLTNYERARKNPNEDVFEWHSEFASKLAIIDKQTLRVKKWFLLNLPFALHTCNAYEENSKIYLDVVAHDEPPILVNEEFRTGYEKIRSQLVRVVVELENQDAEVYHLDDEKYFYNFPRIDDRDLGRKHRYIYLCMTENPSREGVLYNEFLACFDTEEKSKKIYNYGENWFFNEPVYVPGKQEGYVLTVISNCQAQLSKLLIFPANSIDEGPILEANLPHILPYGFHGSWYAEGKG